jgi:LmbE family N-acetylglucosaminyl deacetylase
MKKILVIAPHPDDEVLGCGGVLSLLKNKKKYWLVITKMHEKDGYLSSQIIKREKEIKKISSILNFRKVINLGFRASNLNKDQLNLLINKMSDIIKFIKPDTIFAPYLHDSHSDHFFTTYSLNHILKSFRYPFIKKCYLYETLSETNLVSPKKKRFVPNAYFNISTVLNKKIQLMKIYKSEIKKHPFPRSAKAIKSLAVIRGSESGYNYAEAYELILEKNNLS